MNERPTLYFQSTLLGMYPLHTHKTTVTGFKALLTVWAACPKDSMNKAKFVKQQRVFG